MRNEESRLGLSRQIASCINDTRRDYLVRHPLHEILMTRIFQICMGYEDVNDCDRASLGRMCGRDDHKPRRCPIRLRAVSENENGVKKIAVLRVILKGKPP